MSILVLGGYGGFGGRLSRRLAAAGQEVLVAGRRLDRAERFCAATAGCRPLSADRDGDLTPVLRLHRPALVIDAAGPFQRSGYGVPAACIAAGVPYLDLADGRDFVSGIAALDEQARLAGVPVIAGASSVPALSGAVVRHLCRGLDRITAIEMAISASNQAAAGQSVAAAILGTVGQPIRIWRGGRMTVGYGWQEGRHESFRLGGGTTLGRRWVGLADVPDLDLLPGRIAGSPAIIVRAGTELMAQNRALWLASWLVRVGAVRSLAGLSRVLGPLQRLTSGWGTDRSGMIVRVFGTAGGQRVERRWTLIAERGDGPEIPTIPAALLAARIVAGGVAPGALDAGEELTVEDFAPAFAALAIRHETREIAQPDALYRRVLGARFDALPLCVRDVHSVLRNGGACGRATVTRGGNPLARLIAMLMRFPIAGDHLVHVTFTERDGVERWTRSFSGRAFRSRLSQRGDQLVERFGPLRFRFDLAAGRDGLRMVMRGWSCFGLPLPLALAPRSDAREWEQDGCFHFDVPIALPLIGPVVRYRGWLRRADWAGARP